MLVTDMTDPNWEPVMKRAARHRHQPRRPHLPRGDHRARAGHAGGGRLRRRDRAARRTARWSRCRCAEGDTGYIYDGLLETRGRPRSSAARCRDIPVKITMNVGNPQLAFDFAQLPNAGVGLARLEFIINNNIGVHPKAMPRLPERSTPT